MPFYEYKSKNADKSCDMCRNSFEVMSPISSDPLKKCPKCGNLIIKLVSLPLGFLEKNKEANRYPEVKHAKYWRDRDGNRHKVTAADGHAKSPTVAYRRKRSDEQVAEIKKASAQKSKIKMRKESTQRQIQRAKNNILKNKKK